MSSAEAEYVAAARCCVSILWMKSQLNDLDIHYKMVPIFCENTNAIAISNNPVLGKNYYSTEQVNSIKQLLAYYLITGTKVDTGEIIYSDLITKLLNKSRLKYVSYPRFISCALQALLGSDYTQDEKFGFLPGILSNSNLTKDPSKVTDIKLTAHMIASQGLEASEALSKKRQKPMSKKPPTETKVTPPKPTESYEKSYPVSSGTDWYRSLTKNKGKTSSKVKPDTEPLQLQNFADVHAFILSEHELDKESDEEEVLAAGEDMDKDPQVTEEVRTPSPKQDQPEPSHVQESTCDSSSPDLKKFDNNLPLTERKLIKYLWKMSRYDENVAHRDQTNKLVESTMSTIDKTSTAIKDLYQGLNVITMLLKDINNAVKDDTVTNKKIDEAIETFAKIFTYTIEVLSLFKDFDFSTLQSTMKDLQAHALKQEEESAVWTKSSTNMARNLALIIDKGKGIATESDKDPLKKLVPASTIVHLDPDEEVKVPYMINRKMCYLTNTEMQAYLDKEAKLRKAAEEARLLAISKPEVIKVVKKE
nr:uncharacterized mitochondrial protein AtMg00810-like [Tanacetum cinerariifolium]